MSKHAVIVSNQRAAWIKRIANAATRVSHALPHHTEAVLQKALVSELQSYANINVATEVVQPIVYINSKLQQSVVGSVRLDIVLTTGIGTFVLELKLPVHNKKTTADQLSKYRAALPPSTVLVLVVFAISQNAPALVHVLA
jgi:hypothetical protein